MKNTILICLLILTFSPMLFFPISADISIFIMAGKAIYNGQKIFVDFVDLKPPFFYIIYSFIYSLFGDKELNLRLFDVIYQLITAYFLFKYTSKLKNSDVAWISVFIYAFSYTVIGYSQTMNVESFAGLPLLIILLNIEKSKTSNLHLLTVLICLALLTSIKFSFGLLLFAYFLISYQKPFDIKQLTRIGFSAFIFTLIVLLTFFPLIDSEIYTAFTNVFKYLSFHAGNPPFNFGLLKFGIVETGVFFGDNFGLMFTILLSFSLITIFKNNQYEKFKSIIILMIFLLFSVIWERKFSIYHFSRLYVLFSVFIGIGLFDFYKICKESFIDSDLLKRFVIITLTFFILIQSPVTRYIKIIIPVKDYFTDKNSFNNHYQINNDNQNIRATYLQIAEYIKLQNTNNKNLIVSGIGSNLINYFTPEYQHSKFSQSLFYFGNVKIPEWREDFKKELMKAGIIVIQTDDIHPLLTGHTKSSWECLTENAELIAIINENFTKQIEIGHFLIFFRNGSQ
ncbi:MAG: glycosyltransferase family 39 protein [Candidatus Kapabacteria bacterium]|nr:glycosyltransferase family 39 protein [Candidatus Kapabacteria bacterium]